MNIEKAKEKIFENGYLNLDVDPSLDLFEEIEKLKKENWFRFRL